MFPKIDEEFGRWGKINKTVLECCCVVCSIGMGDQFPDLCEVVNACANYFFRNKLWSPNAIA